MTDPVTPGLFCSPVGRPADSTALQICHRYCATNSDCSDGEFCLRATPAAPHAGTCAASCDPFADACPGSQGCLSFADMDGVLRLSCQDFAQESA